MSGRPEDFPEIPQIESSIVRDFLLASEQEIVPKEDEWDLLRYPLVGKSGFGESLFKKFERDATDHTHGYMLLIIKTFPSALGPLRFRTSLQSHEGNALIFNDSLAGVDVQLLHHEERGVVSFTLVDNNDPGSYARIMYADRSYRTIKGTAGFTVDGQAHECDFIPTSSAQLVLLNIARLLSESPST
ncbi:MAG: hypothetical protein AAB541_01525 [Patescibacteria group bacterium]